MTADDRSPVTAEDVAGLREALDRVGDAVDDMADRQTLLEGIVLPRWVVALAMLVALVAVGIGGYAWKLTNDVTRNRTQGRVGLCVAIDDMHTKHNHFVETTIAERQRVIDETNANPNISEAQKAATASFFEQEIADYRSDLLPILDCAQPSQVDSLFTTTTTTKPR